MGPRYSRRSSHLREWSSGLRRPSAKRNIAGSNPASRSLGIGASYNRYMKQHDVLILERLLDTGGAYPNTGFGYLAVVGSQAADNTWVVYVDSWTYTLFHPDESISANRLWRLVENLGQL